MAKSVKRDKEMANKRAKKASVMDKPGSKSNYAKKTQYLNANGGRGTDYREPKPWKYKVV